MLGEEVIARCSHPASLGPGTCILSLHAPLSCWKTSRGGASHLGPGQAWRPECWTLGAAGWRRQGMGAGARAPGRLWGSPAPRRRPFVHAPHLPDAPGRDGVARVSPQHGQEQEPHGPPPPAARPGLAKWQWPGRGGPGRASGRGPGLWVPATGCSRWCRDGDAFLLHADRPAQACMPCGGLVSTSTEQSLGAPLARGDSAGDRPAWLLAPGRHRGPMQKAAGEVPRAGPGMGWACCQDAVGLCPRRPAEGTALVLFLGDLGETPSLGAGDHPSAGSSPVHFGLHSHKY